MSVERVKSLVKTKETMKKMKNEAVSPEAKEDLLTMQKAAYDEIADYLDKIAENLNGKYIVVDFPEITYIGRIAHIYFNDKVPKRIDESERFPWNITCEGRSEDRIFKQYYSVNRKIPDEYICNPKENMYKYTVFIIENWKMVKERITKAIEAALEEDMKKYQDDVVNFTERYQKAASFEI